MNSYLRGAFNELFAEDGLVVVGRGLGVNDLFCKFAQYFANREGGRKLVFCINCTGYEEQLSDLFLSNSDGSIKDMPQVINNEVPIQDRVEKYTQGGCYIITSRILIVDLLDNKVDAKSVSGLLVYNAHRVSETSVESFIIKVFRERNRNGFVKAFSEDPEALHSGFGKVERLMRVLYVKKLYMWPRFRLEIVEALKRNGEPEVIELVTNLTPCMKNIQSAILAAMNTCIQELKKAAPQLETSQMTLENGLFQAFDFSIKNQLEAEWHRTPQRTKQLVADVGVLRKLLDYLIRYDAFAFYYLLMKLQQASTEQATPSLWLLSEAANVIFKRAKERVYRLAALGSAGKAAPSSSSSSSGLGAETERSRQREEIARSHGLRSVLQATGECPPKWRLAEQVMAEIKQDYVSKTAHGPGGAAQTGGASAEVKEHFHARGVAGRVLFIVKDGMAQAQLRDVLVAGVDRVRDQRYRWFVSQQAAEIRSRARKLYAQQQQQTARRYKRPAGSAGVGGSELPPSKAGRAEDSSRNAFLYPNETELMSTADPLPPLAGQSGEGEQSGLMGLPDKGFRELPEESKLILIEEYCLRLASSVDAQASVPRSVPCSVPVQSAPRNTRNLPAKALSQEEEDRYAGSAEPLDPDLHVTLMTHSEAKESFTALRDCAPAYVVLYDPDITLIRYIETYQAGRPAHSPPVRVYFILYEGSGEEHRYAGALMKEKRAFESLIAAKEHMVISLPDHPEDVQQEAQADKLLLSVDTRTVNRGSSSSSGKGGGKRGIVVDVRDFRSTLPSALYVSGKFNVIPRTLVVGDYVLAPEVCVERKGIADLFQSFASGRLYNQVEAMGRHYKYPCLLIEFSADKAFGLLAANELSADILNSAITSRIALLALSFPGLRILWSRSALATVDIFRALVSNHEEADVAKAVAAGSIGGMGSADGAAEGTGGEAYGDDGFYGDDMAGDEAGGGRSDAASKQGRGLLASRSGASLGGGARGEADLSQENARASAQEILLSLPGINVHNYRDVMAAVTNLAELSAMSVEQLEPLVGPVNAKKLYTFFGQSA